jgi:hypothetical protein
MQSLEVFGHMDGIESSENTRELSIKNEQKKMKTEAQGITIRELKRGKERKPE